MKILLLSVLALIGANLLAAPKAYVPPRRDVQRVQVIAPGDVAVTVAGQNLRPDTLTERRSLNGAWRISGLENSTEPYAADADLALGYEKPDFDDSGWDEIPVPLDWYRQYRQAYQKDKPYVKGWYRRQIELSEEDLTGGRRAVLHFVRIGYEALIFINEIGRASCRERV